MHICEIARIGILSLAVAAAGIVTVAHVCRPASTVIVLSMAAPAKPTIEAPLVPHRHPCWNYRGPRRQSRTGC